MTFLYLISIIWLWWFVFHNARIKDLQMRVKELEKENGEQHDQIINLSKHYASLKRHMEGIENDQ